RYDEFRDKYVAAVEALTLGDPLDEATDIGPLINDHAAERVQAWVQEAVADGARRLAGGDGEGEGRVLRPVVLENVDARMKVMCEEVFGPVVSLVPYDDFEAALAEVD